MDNPNVATTVAELQQKPDAAVVQERIASRALLAGHHSSSPFGLSLPGMPGY